LRVKPYYCRWCDYNCMHHSSIRDHLSKCHPDKSHNSCEPGYIFNSQAVPEPESSICEMPPTLCALSNTNQTQIKQQEQQQQDNDEDNNDTGDNNQEKKVDLQDLNQQQQQQQSSSRRRKRKLDNVFLNKFRLQKEQSKQQSPPNATITSTTPSPLSPSASNNSSSVSPISTLSSSNGSPNNLSQLQLAQQQSNAFYLNNMAAAAFIHRMNTTAALMQQFNNSTTNGGLLLPLKQQQQQQQHQQLQSQCQTTPKKGLLLKKFLKKSKLNMISGSNPLDLSLANGNYFSEEGENEFEGIIKLIR
jgi:hypothetical protein